jgi:glycosyltransferase involved in cell wall biosynthesis
MSGARMLKTSLTNLNRIESIWHIRRNEDLQVDRHYQPGAGDDRNRERTGRFEPKRPRLIVVGRGRRATGFGRLMHSVLDRLDALVPVDDKPDVVLAHVDAVLDADERAAVIAPGGAPVVVYCPVDAAVLPARLPEAVAGAARIITFTQFGANALRAAFSGAGIPAPPIEVIPLGVDRHLFHALGERADDGRFVVLNGNANIPRKRVDVTLRGFAEFANGRPDAFLYLHMGMRDHGYDVMTIAKDLGIDDRLLATTGRDSHPQVSDDELNRIYTSCDVGLNTAEAEGWGLVAFEHAATGAAQVVPDGGACAELWDEPRGALRIAARRTPQGGHEVTPADVAATLARLYEDRGLLGTLGARAHAYATAPEFDWDAITRTWEDVLLDVVARAAHARSSVR